MAAFKELHSSIHSPFRHCLGGLVQHIHLTVGILIGARVSAIFVDVVTNLGESR